MARVRRTECRDLVEDSERSGFVRYNEVSRAIPQCLEQDYCSFGQNDCEHLHNPWNVTSECINEGVGDRTNKAFGSEGTMSLERIRQSAGTGDAADEAYTPGKFKMALGIIVDQKGNRTDRELAVEGRLRTEAKYGEKYFRGSLRLDGQTAAVLREKGGVRAVGLIDTVTSEVHSELILGASSDNWLWSPVLEWSAKKRLLVVTSGSCRLHVIRMQEEAMLFSSSIEVLIPLEGDSIKSVLFDSNTANRDTFLLLTESNRAVVATINEHGTTPHLDFLPSTSSLFGFYSLQRLGLLLLAAAEGGQALVSAYQTRSGRLEDCETRFLLPIYCKAQKVGLERGKLDFLVEESEAATTETSVMLGIRLGRAELYYVVNLRKTSTVEVDDLFRMDIEDSDGGDEPSATWVPDIMVCPVVWDKQRNKWKLLDHSQRVKLPGTPPN